MIQSLENTIKKYKMIETEDRVVIGLSGGADSVALLYLLMELKSIEIVAGHVHHGLRGKEADLDEQFVVGLCKRENIPLETFHYRIYDEAKRLKLTAEEAGRMLRYQAFEQTRQKYGANKIAVAHNKNDNVETVLMRLCRGTGLKGLSGIAPVRGNIIRPLIETARCEIEEYCTENNIEYCTDSTNLKPIYTRNKIRLELIPFLQKEFNPEIISSISKMSALLHEEGEYLESVATEAYDKCLAFKTERELALNIERLKEYPVSIQRRVIREAYQSYAKSIYDIVLVHIEGILSLLNKESGKAIDLPYQICARREYGLLLLYKKNIDKAGFHYNIILDEPVFINEINAYALFTLNKPVNNCNIIYTKIFCYDKIEGVIQIRSRMPGDKIFVKSMGGNKRIKDYFIDGKIPRQQRANIPLLAIGSDILWIIDNKGIVSDLYKADADTNIRAYVQIFKLLYS